MSTPTEERLSALSGRVTLWLARAGAVGLAIIMILTFFDVVGRYLFNAPIIGAVDVIELMMGMMIYLGVGLTTYSRGHIRVDLVIDRMRGRLRALCDVLTLGISIVVVALICWQLWARAELSFDKGDLTQIWEWHIWPVAYVMAACSILIVTSLMLQFVDAARDLFRRAP